MTFARGASFLGMFAAISLAALPAQAREVSPSAAEMFAIGTSGTVCEAQGVAMGAARRSIFERKWAILCSDVARPVGSALALRGDGDLMARAAALRGEALDCGAASDVTIEGIGTVRAASCRSGSTGLEWKLYSRQSGATHYAVEGLAGYDSALRLALANLVADRIVPGEVQAANLGSGDAGGIAKARAAVGGIDMLIGQGYRSNSAGAYTEAAELFAAAPSLLDSDGGSATQDRESRLHELKVNRALQLSNLGDFDQAARLFGEADALGTRDGVQARLARNFEAIDTINRGELGSVAAILDRPVPPVSAPAIEGGDAVTIDRATSAGLNASSGQAQAGILGQETRLSPSERAKILDAQALQLRGTVQRREGQSSAARATLARAYSDAMQVREGRVISIIRLRAQILTEMALSHEAEGQIGAAEALLVQARQLVEGQYPESASVNAAQARLAGFWARNGRKGEALTLYRGIVSRVAGNRDALVGMANLMRPYFDLLTASGTASPQDVSDLFLASQLVERPGAADSLAQLTRQLEGGNNQAAAQFRESLVLSREMERNRIRIAQQTAQIEAGGSAEGLGELQARQQRLLDEQLKLMTSLGAFPQYRAVAKRSATLDDMRALLAPGEAYLKLVQLSDSIYGVFVSPTSAKGWRVAKSAGDVSTSVAALRDSISATVNGVRMTYPFDLDTAADLHDALFAPVAGELASVKHLVFEPDGAMLQLPLNLLTGDRAGIAAYHARVAAGGDEYDFTGIDWLGRNTAVSTALSAASFRDARAAPGSKASRSYLGLGQNLPLGQVSMLPGGIRSAAGMAVDEGCEWPVAAWNRPISDAELRVASGVFGAGSSDLMTGSSFTDTAIIGRGDLSSYRMVHFATHGLVTAPRDGCPARQALLTSFGSGSSDGLLGFAEIFDLQLDAELVILSACDTASQASLEATREAGITTGGGQALDGLVRAFIAAGGRQVIASHWPAPDDYGATRRLFSGFFADRGDSIGNALLQSQRQLMDDRETSHPFYWSGFAVIGDGARKIAGR